MIINKENLIKNIRNELSDNSVGEISPRDIRHNLIDIIDSVHLLTKDSNIDSLNIGTPETRNVRIGHRSLESIKLDGYTSTDNIAIGYSSLRSSYRTKRNTAIGSFALSCNIHGEGNLAIGYNSLAGNTTGFSNVALGAHSLNNNKTGNFNIAIGNAAGYYIDRDTSYKFFLASHPVDESYICDNPEGVGLVPTIYGDLQSNSIGINTPSLHEGSVLQTGGDIDPSQDLSFNLGSSSFRWNNLYLQNALFSPIGTINSDESIFVNSRKINLNAEDVFIGGNVEVSGNILPSVTEQYNLGSMIQRWGKGYFDSIFSNYLTAFQKSFFSNKTLYLASSGEWSIDGGGPSSLYEYYPCSNSLEINPILSDDEIVGGGFVLQSTEDSYYFTFQKDGYPCGPNKRWKSNIGIELYGDESYISATALVGSLTNNCFGIFMSGTKTFFSEKHQYIDHEQYSSNADINFYRNELSDTPDYDIVFHSLSSGVNISQKFLSSRSIPRETVDQVDVINGFELKYFDDNDIDSDRFVIRSFDNDIYSSNHLTLMSSKSYGVLGLNNFKTFGELAYPETTFNIRSSNDSIIRSTAENYDSSISALQLLAHQNCLNSGVEFVYSNHSGIFDLNIYDNYSKNTVLSSPSGISLGIFASGDPQDLLTIGSSGYNSHISIFESYSKPSPKEEYGKLFIYEKISNNQSQTIIFLDDEGNEHDIVLNKYNAEDGLILSENGNTFGGLCPDVRGDIPNASNNTAFGYQALNNITVGDCNTMYGFRAGSSIETGYNNIGIGCNAFQEAAEDINHNIAIGCDSVGSNIEDNYNFHLGYSDTNLLFEAKLGPSTNQKHLYMPDGKITLYGPDKGESLHISNNTIRLEDHGGSDTPENELVFKFKGNETNDLVVMNHSYPPMDNNTFYRNNLRPWMELMGDLKLRGGICFADGSFISGTNELNKIPIIEQKIEDIFVEGHALEDIPEAINIEDPSIGILKLRDGRQLLITNRDKYLKIRTNDYVIAIKINSEYRPIWISNESSVCNCCTR